MGTYVRDYIAAHVSHGLNSEPYKYVPPSLAAASTNVLPALPPPPPPPPPAVAGVAPQPSRSAPTFSGTYAKVRQSHPQISARTFSVVHLLVPSDPYPLTLAFRATEPSRVPGSSRPSTAVCALPVWWYVWWNSSQM